MESLYKDVLQLTEKIESLLEHGDGDIAPFLIKWQEAFSQLPGEISSQDVATVIERIIACQERCVGLALEKKKEIQSEMQETRNRKRLHQAYGKHVAVI
jgi:hypothetical protein